LIKIFNKSLTNLKKIFKNRLNKIDAIAKLFFNFNIQMFCMKKNTRLLAIEKMLKEIKEKKVMDDKIIDKIRFDLDQEEVISRNYLQITQNGIFSQNKKKAVLWNKQVMDLKEELNSIIADNY